MRVDISPQWKKLANWYWDSNGGYEGAGGRSIWEMLEHDYGAIKVYHGVRGGKLGTKNQSIVQFPDEKTYTMFLLRFG